MGNRDHTHSEEFEVRNQYGIHARPAALLVKTASSFLSDITLINNGVSVSGKSIMGLLTIEGYKGARIRVTAVGDDAPEAVKAIGELFEKNFYEE
jgi:phosphocarrier protein HPr